MPRCPQNLHPLMKENYPFPEGIWILVQVWHDAYPGTPIYSFSTILKWCDGLIRGRPKNEQRSINCRLLYVHYASSHLH
jgi:hypothetical protein